MNHTKLSRPLRLLLPLMIGAITLGTRETSLASRESPLSEPPQEMVARLGIKLFMDTRLSNPPGQACVSCHRPRFAFTDPDRSFPTSKGAVANRFGSRNTPTMLYSSFSPAFTRKVNSAGESEAMGGQFFDGRAATLADQAAGPFLNPIEMNNTDKKAVVEKLKALHEKDFVTLFGSEVFADIETAFKRMTEAIASAERLVGFNPFSSKYDAYLKHQTTLTAQELRGLELFEAPGKGNCAACHSSQIGSQGEGPLFTRFTYENLGVPPNPANPFYQLESAFNPLGSEFRDLGLGGITGEFKDRGKFKVPTLRNIAVTAPYMHNGYFESLKAAIEFHSSRDTRASCLGVMVSEKDAEAQNCWPSAEVPENVIRRDVGRLNLTAEEIDDIIAFLEALTDGWLG